MDSKNFRHRIKEAWLRLSGFVGSARRRGVLFAATASLLTVVMLASFVLIKRFEVKVFVDGRETVSFSTLDKNSENWLSRSGVRAFDGDKVEVYGTNVYVTRAFYVTISVDGEMKSVRTTGTTVAEALAEAGVELGDEDIIDTEPMTVVDCETAVRVTRVKSETVTEKRETDFKTVEKKTSALFAGDTRVETEGQKGEIEAVYAVKYVNGEPAERTLIKETVVKEPVDKVVLVGTKQKPKAAAVTASAPASYKAAYTMRATAYTYGDDGGNVTYTGVSTRRGIVAVDPSVIPLGTRLYIEGYGSAVAGDIGSAIKGDRIDLFMETESECISFGRRSVTVYVLE